MNKIINQSLHEHRSHIDEIIKDLHKMTLDIGHEELAETVSDLRNRINEPFMFVIVGEVKAGKSSFINALLATDKEVCAVAPDPCTDTIQQVIYGEEEKTTVVNEHLKKIYLPVEILKEIAIVDTPGTNTISDYHQEITERFIPASDLIVFVFESKNPYRQSAWDFFDYIHEDWRKKIIFILQQKDLMEPEDLIINIEGVKKYALKKGIDAPNVFAVSAKQEQKGDLANSGFIDVRNYIQENITGGKAPFLKLENNIETARNIGRRISDGMVARKAQWEADMAFRSDVRGTLDKQEQKSNYQVDLLVENLLATYDRVTSNKTVELEEGLSFFSLLKRSFTSIFSKQESATEWLDRLGVELETELKDELVNKLNDGVHDIADSIQQMAKMIDLKIQNSKSILKDNHEIFSDIADRRASVLAELQDAFRKFMNRSENFLDAELFANKESFSPNIATGSGMVVIGAILTMVTQGVVFDITGGILSTIGILFAGVSVGRKRRKVVAEFKEEIKKGRIKLEDEIESKLKTYIKNIKEKIDANFHNFDALLANETEQIEQLHNQYDSISERLDSIEQNLNI